MVTVGPGDVIALSTLAWCCYKMCKDSSEQFRRIATEVSNLRATLDEVTEAVEENQPLSPTRQARLDEAIKQCERCLRDLETLLGSYESMYTQKQRVYDRFRFGVKDIADIRQRMISHTTSLGVISQGITNSGMKKIEIRLLKLCAEHRAGLRQWSVISSRSSTTSDVINAEWDSVKREVEDVGISASVVDENRDAIQKWLKNAVAAGRFDEDPALVNGHLEAETATKRSKPFNHDDFSLPDSGLGSKIGANRSDGSISIDSPEDRESVIQSDEDDINALTKVSLNDQAQLRDSMEEFKEETGSDPDQPPSLIPTTKRRKSSGIHSLFFKLFSSDQRIIQAASDGIPDEVSRLLGLGADVNTKDRWGWTAMSMAAYGGHEEVARVLISHGCSINHKDVDGDTPYVLAFNKGHRNLVMMIEEETTRRAIQDDGAKKKQNVVRPKMAKWMTL